MILSLIVAMAQNRVIGRENRLPWHLPEDLKRFKQVTSGHPVVMGRKTYESIGRLLPNRTNIIISRQPGYHVEGAVVADSLEKALAPYRDSKEEVFILGGGEIFKMALPKADRLYLTLIHQDVEGDVFFPSFDNGQFVQTSREDRDGAMPFSFLLLERK